MPTIHVESNYNLLRLLTAKYNTKNECKSQNDVLVHDIELPLVLPYYLPVQ